MISLKKSPSTYSPKETDGVRQGTLAKLSLCPVAWGMVSPGSWLAAKGMPVLRPNLSPRCRPLWPNDERRLPSSQGRRCCGSPLNSSKLLPLALSTVALRPPRDSRSGDKSLAARCVWEGFRLSNLEVSMTQPQGFAVMRAWFSYDLRHSTP